MNLQEIGWGLDCTDLAQDRKRVPALDSTVINRRITQNMGKALTSLERGSFWRRTLLYAVSYLEGVSKLRFSA